MATKKKKCGEGKSDLEAQESVVLPCPSFTKARVQRVCRGERDLLKPAAQTLEAETHHRPLTRRLPYVMLEEGLYIRPPSHIENASGHNPLEAYYPAEPILTREDADHLVGLVAIMIPGEELKGNGYILEDLTAQQLERKKRCAGCGKTMGSLFMKNDRRRKEPGSDNLATDPRPTPYENEKRAKQEALPVMSELLSDMPRMVCRFHPDANASTALAPGGRKIQNKVCTNCNQPFSATPCSGTEHHRALDYPAGEFEQSWYHHRITTPTSTTEIRHAVALDCEMGTTVCGDSELIRVTMIDYFSSIILVDRLVYPNVPMLHFNTKFSGVTRSAMMEAKKNRNCFFGRDNAREALWKFVGLHTIVVGHALNNDLTALRWRHGNIVDTHLLKELIPPKHDSNDTTGRKAEKLADTCSGTLNGAADGVISKNLTAQETQAGLQDMHILAGALDDTAYSTLTPAINSLRTSTTDQENEFEGDKYSVQNYGIQSFPTDCSTPTQVTAIAHKRKKCKEYGPMSLKTLTLARLGRVIQDSKKTGHDSLEDAIATRDLARLVVCENVMRKEDVP